MQNFDHALKHNTMKIIVATLLLAFLAFFQIASAEFQAYNVKKVSITGEPFPHEAAEFLKGFVYGLESDVSANVTKCLEDSHIALHDFEAAFTDLQYGFKHLSVHHVEKGIHELSAGIEEVNVVLKDCNATELVREIEELVSDLRDGAAGILHIVVKEAVNIFHHSKELTGDFKTAIQFWEQRQWNLCGVSVGKLVGILLNYDPKLDAVNSELSCFTKCLGKKYDVWTILKVIGECKVDKKCYLQRLGADASACIDKCVN